MQLQGPADAAGKPQALHSSARTQRPAEPAALRFRSSGRGTAIPSRCVPAILLSILRAHGRLSRTGGSVSPYAAEGGKWRGPRFVMLLCGWLRAQGRPLRREAECERQRVARAEVGCRHDTAQHGATSLPLVAGRS